jgi:ATP-dependent RNA helicase DDX47/RRP3
VSFFFRPGRMALVPEEEEHLGGTFRELGLCEEALSAVEELGFTKPTRIQAMAIPHALQGRDIIGISQTGSGKTASYALPIIHKLLDTKGKKALRALVLCPTRELCKQVAEHFQMMGKTVGLRVISIIGGEEMSEQALKLAQKPHVVISTPGRMKDHLEGTKGFNLNHLQFLVLDEADKMLDYDYEADLLAILELIPRQRQTALYSATMTTRVEKLQKASLQNPVRVEVTSKHSTVDTLTQQYLFIPYHYKAVYLYHVLSQLEAKVKSFLVFCEACHVVTRLTRMLRKLGISALPLTGQMSQDRRQTSLGMFREGKFKVMVGTDVASRGLDIDHVDVVVNYSLPTSAKDYIHRVGRTARAGREGLAVSFVTQYDVLQVQQIEALIGLKLTPFPCNKKDVELLHQRVGEAEQQAALEAKELHQRKQVVEKRMRGDAPPLKKPRR